MNDCIAYVIGSTLNARDDQYKMICHVHYFYNDYKDNEHAGMHQTGYIKVELFNNTTTIIIGNPLQLPVQEREIGVLQWEQFNYLKDALNKNTMAGSLSLTTATNTAHI